MIRHNKLLMLRYCIHMYIIREGEIKCDLFHGILIH